MRDLRALIGMPVYIVLCAAIAFVQRSGLSGFLAEIAEGER